MSRSRKAHSNALHVEELESRRMMAGVVTATYLDGKLTLTGDSQDNWIEVRGLPGNRIQLVSLDGATEIRGGTKFANVTSLSANLKRGEDVLKVTDAKFAGALDILMGDDADSIILNGVDAKSVQVDSGAGHDAIFLSRVSAGRATVLAGEGNSVIGVNDSRIGSLRIETGNQIDRILVDTVMANAINITTKAGSDLVAMANVTGKNSSRRANDLVVNMGKDLDVLAMAYVKARNVEVNGGGDLAQDAFLSFGMDVKRLVHRNFEQSLRSDAADDAGGESCDAHASYKYPLHAPRNQNWDPPAPHSN